MDLLGESFRRVGLDFETYYGPKYSLSLQAMNTFKYVADPQFLIHGCAVRDEGQPARYYDFHDQTQRLAFHAYIQSLRKHNVAMVNHNAPFDSFILHFHFGYHPAFYLDTMAMSRGMFVGQPADLKALAIRLWPRDLSLRKKDDLAKTYGLRELPPEINAALAAYAIRDIEITDAALDVMLPHFPDSELRLIDWTVRAMCVPRLMLDDDLVQEEVDAQVVLTRDTIAACGVAETVLKSDKKFVELLHSLNIQYETKDNAKGTDRIPALAQKDWGWLRMYAKYPEHRALFDARKVAKSNIQESRARWMLAVSKYNDGLLPVPLNYYGAATSRWSGGEKLNLQNLPRIDEREPTSGRLRRAIRALKGQMIIVRDLNNIEGRILAWEAHEDYLLDLFRRGECPYLYMAESIYHAPHGTFTKKDNYRERLLGKVAVLGLGYGLSANGFWIAVNVGPMGNDPIPMGFDEASNVVNIYRTTNARIVAFWRACDGAIQYMASLDPGKSVEFGPFTLMRDTCILPNGMALQYPGLHGVPNEWGGHDFFFGGGKKLYGSHFAENLTQALARVLLGEQLLEVQDELDANYGRANASVVHCVHDELIAVGPEAEADSIYQMMGGVMSKSPSWAPDLPLLSEGGFDTSYSK